MYIIVNIILLSLYQYCVYQNYLHMISLLSCSNRSKKYSENGEMSKKRTGTQETLQIREETTRSFCTE